MFTKRLWSVVLLMTLLISGTYWIPATAQDETPPPETPETIPAEPQPTREAGAAPIGVPEISEPDGESGAPEGNQPPTFQVSDQSQLVVAPGGTLVFAIVVMDDGGVVRLTLDEADAVGVLTLTMTAPAEIAAPFVTRYEALYTAPADFAGEDTLHLTATDMQGMTATVSITITVSASDSAPVRPEPPEIPPNATEERLIAYDPLADEASIEAMLGTLGAVELERLPEIGVIRVMMPAATASTEAAQAAINSSGSPQANRAGLRVVEENGTYSAHFEPNDPYYEQGYQWNFNSGAGQAYVYIAWSITRRAGRGVTVAVLDSGIDLEHPEFRGQLTRGWDFVNDDNSPDADHPHGTHVAGIIAANTNNREGIASIAYGAKLMPVKVLDEFNLGTWFNIAAGIIYAVDNRADVINMSLGGGSYSTTVAGAVQYAITQDVVVVASAGNTYDTTYQYPASLPDVISVAAHDFDGDIADFSTQNDRVTLSAPGVSVFSTVPIELGSYEGGPIWSGTSMAAPHVSGVAALLISDRIATTPQAVREALICSAYDINGGGYDNAFGYGILQADWALTWRDNAASCQITLPHDDFDSAMRIRRTPFTDIQPFQERNTSIEPGDLTQYAGNVWYEFTPSRSGIYNFDTFGSSFDTTLAIVQGVPGEFNIIRYNDDVNYGEGLAMSHIAVPLTGRQTYYILVDAIGIIEDEVMQLNVTESTFRHGRTAQENDRSLVYSGTWAETRDRAASGGRYFVTSDDTAALSFSFQGHHFCYTRMVGPGFGSTEIWINGELWGTVNNRAAYLDSQVICPFANPTPGSYNTVMLRRDADGAEGPITVDGITIYEVEDLRPVRGTADDRDRRLSYWGYWLEQDYDEAYRRTWTWTEDESAFVRARVSGSTITIWRAVSPGYGSMTVYVDGLAYPMSNEAADFYPSVPFVIPNLTETEHVVEIYNDAGSVLVFDAIDGSSPRALRAGRMTDNRDRNLSYSGYWTEERPTDAYRRSTHRTTSGGRLSFPFEGNKLCVWYVAQPGGGDMSLYVDGGLQGTVDTSSAGTDFNMEFCTPVLSEGTHFARVITSGGVVEIDAVEPIQYPTINPDDRVVQENDRAITYYDAYGPWYTLSGSSARSEGGFSAQGGRMYYTNADGARLSFTFNGSGFILYTSTGPTIGGWQIYIDGALHDTVDLYDGYRWRPLAYGVTDLAPGIHEVWLIADIEGGALFADFDGVRVFP